MAKHTIIYLFLFCLTSWKVGVSKTMGRNLFKLEMVFFSTNLAALSLARNLSAAGEENKA